MKILKHLKIKLLIITYLIIIFFLFKILKFF